MITYMIKNCFIWTRVSTKHQEDNGGSLDDQKCRCEKFAKDNGYTIKGYFGGKHESAKTPGKLIKEMIAAIKKDKTVKYIIVNQADRFSRNAGQAINIINDLKAQSVTIVEASTGSDTSTPEGVMMMQFKLSLAQWDNTNRTNKFVSGRKHCMESGVWIGKRPIGYNKVGKSINTEYTINETGKLIRKAFKWKLQGVDNFRILDRLSSMGLHICKQKLHKILTNPFYAGKIKSSFTNGEIIDGKHPAIISWVEFLQVQDILSGRTGIYKVKAETPQFPLKRHIRCAYDGLPFTAYTAKKKNIDYYKARYLFCANTGERIQVSLSGIELDAAKGRIFVRGGSDDYPFSEIFADGTAKRYTYDQYGSFSRIYFDVNGQPCVFIPGVGRYTLDGKEITDGEFIRQFFDSDGSVVAAYGNTYCSKGTSYGVSALIGSLCGDRFLYSDEDGARLIYDLSENTIYRYYFKGVRDKERSVACNLFDGKHYITSYHPQTVTVGGISLEVMNFDVITAWDGTQYLLAFYPDHADLYRIDPGYETEPVEPSGPPIQSEPPALPPEEELSMELALRFDMGPGHPTSLWAYTDGYPEYGVLRMEAVIDADGLGSFYMERYDGILRINDGKLLSEKVIGEFRDTLFLNGSLYVLLKDGTVSSYDLPAGFESGVPQQQWKPFSTQTNYSHYLISRGGVPLIWDSKTEKCYSLDGQPVAVDINGLWECVYTSDGGTDLWLEDRFLSEDIQIAYGEHGEVVSRIKVSIEQPYQYQPCEIRYSTNEYGGDYATVRYYRPCTVKVNELTFEKVLDYQYIVDPQGNLYLALFYADYGEIYAITRGVTHEELTPVTEENSTRKIPTLVTLYDFEGEELGELLDDPAGYTFKRGRNISIYDLHCSSSHEYWHVHLRDSLKELAGDRTAMEAYLKEQGYDVKVSRIVALDVKYAPFTLMALTESGEAYFVTVRDLRGSEEQFYKVYSVKEFRNSFLSRKVKLYLFEDAYEWETTYPVTIENESAMIPVISALQALGGNVEWQNGSAKITMAGKQCFVHPGDLCIAYGDEEWIYTEPYIVDSKGDELLMRSIELQSFFDVFCPGVEIRVDIANNAVYIERKARSEKETTMELVEEIPVNDPRSPIFLQYNIGESFYGQIITPTRFLVDLNGDIYCVVGVELFRLRDSAGFRLIDPNDTEERSVSSVAVYNGTIYVAYKSSSGQKGELVAYDITGKVLSSAALPAAKYGEYYYLFIFEDGKPKVLFGNDIYSRTGQKVGVLNAEADVTYGVTIGGVTHSMTNEPLILSRLGGVSTIREIQEKRYGTDPAKRHCIREEIFHQYDKAGNLVSEFKLTEFSCGKEIPCHVAIGEAVCTSVSLETVTIGENVFEGVYSCRVVPGADGKLYAILIYTDGTRIYRIDPGYSDVEFRDLDAIENPKAECLICKAPAPAEKETTLEKVFTFDIGPNGVMEYNFFFEGDPSKGNIGLPGDFFADGDGNYYFAVGNRLVRLNDGAILPKRCINYVIDVEICGNTLYMLDSIGTAYQLDISNGFASATLEAEYPVFRYGYDSSGSLIRYGDTVLYQSREGLLYTLDKTLLTGNSAPYQFVTGNEVFVTLDRDTATLLINKNANENISVRAITSAGISISDYTGYMMDVENLSQAIFSTYDLSGKATSRFMMTTVYQSESTWGRVEFHYGDGLKTTIVYRPQDIMVGKKIFEDVLMGRMYCGMDGNFYFVAYHVNRADVYLVNAG